MTSAGVRQPRPGRVSPRVGTGASPIAPVAVTRKGGAGFMWLVAAIALGSALCLLLLNTMRSEQSFTLTRLQNQVAVLDDEQQALQSDISALSAPESLALKADSMGLVHAQSVKFVQRSNGKVLGVSVAPQAGTAISVDTIPQSAASSAASEVLAAGLIGNHVGQSPAKTPAASSSAGNAAATAGQSAGRKGVVVPQKSVNQQPVTKNYVKSRLGVQSRVTSHVVAPAKSATTRK